MKSIYLFLFLIVKLAWSKTIYVDDNSSTGGNGSSWGSSYRYLQDAISSAVSGDEIWVAEGTYKPDQGFEETTGDRKKSFRLVDGVSIIGGFAGVEKELPARGKFKDTILTGKISTGSKNSYHVVVAENISDPKTILKGFTIKNGVASGGVIGTEVHSIGGGFVILNSSIIIENCAFIENAASNLNASGGQGGAIYVNQSSPVFINCLIQENNASNGGGVFISGGNATFTDSNFSSNRSTSGGAVSLTGANANAYFQGCIFEDNNATVGGAFRNQSKSTFANCVFDKNKAIAVNNSSNSVQGVGGAILNESTRDLIFQNCIFFQNNATFKGGAITNVFQDKTKIVNSLFYKNESIQGGSIFNESSTGPLISNSIFWENTSNDNIGHGIAGSTIWISRSNFPNILQGADESINFLSNDPLFINPLSPKGTDKKWLTNDDGFMLSQNSKAINTGNKTQLIADSVDIDNDTDFVEYFPYDSCGEQRIKNGLVDIGPYEFDPEVTRVENTNIILTSGLVAYFPFDGNASDMSGNGNHGTIINSNFETGKILQSLKIKSNQSIVNISGSKLNLGDYNKCSLTLWFKMEKMSAYGTLFSVGKERANKHLGMRLEVGGIYQNEPMPAWWKVLYANGSTEILNFRKFGKAANSFIKVNTWYHLVVTHDGQKIKSYINSEFDNEIAVANSNKNENFLFPINGVSSIGTEVSYQFPDHPMFGLIDDFRIYNRDLSVTEITRLYELGTSNQVDIESKNFSIELLAQPLAGGSVSGAGEFSSGSSRTLTATPNDGYTFSHWSGDVNGSSNPISIVLSSQVSLTANFESKNSTAQSKVNGSLSNYNPSRTYSVGDLVLLGTSTYIAVKNVPLNISPPNTNYWGNLMDAAEKLNIPSEQIPSLSTSVILEALTAVEPAVEQDYIKLERSPIFRSFATSASIEIYSPLFDYSSLLTLSDTQIIEYNVQDYGLSSGKIRSNGLMRVEGINTTFTSELNSFDAEKDENRNGIPDFYEASLSYNIQITGNINLTLQGYGSALARIDANIYRTPPNYSLTVSETVTIQNSTIQNLPVGYSDNISLTISPIYSKGTLNYNPTNNTYSCEMSHYGTYGDAFTTGSYSINNSAFKFSELPFPSIGDRSLQDLLPALGKNELYSEGTFTHIGSGVFHGMITVEGIPYFVKITDTHDFDKNGIPNILENKSNLKSFSSQITETRFGTGWKSLDWFGYYWIDDDWQYNSSSNLNTTSGLSNDSFRCWMYHSFFGWVYVSSGGYQVSNLGNGFSAWIYFPDQGWRYTDGLIFPNLYDNKSSKWLYFDARGSTPRLLKFQNSKWDVME